MRVRCLAIINSNVIAGTLGEGLFLTSDNGNNWISVNTGLKDLNVWSMSSTGMNLFAGTDSGVFMSTNNGGLWTDINTGLIDPNINSLFVNGDNLFLGTWGNGVWIRPLSEITYAKNNIRRELPRKYFLQQNYPNPFNSTTKISFGISNDSFVSLKVFDALGREVSILLFDNLPAGYYFREWNAANNPSGVYFYRLHAGSFSESKKILLVK